MDRADLERQLSEVVQAAHETLREPAQAARLWGSTILLCDALERHGHGPHELVMIIALREDIRAGARSVEDLADEIVWFVQAIQRDLFEEEREAVLDDVVCCDQLDG